MIKRTGTSSPLRRLWWLHLQQKLRLFLLMCCLWCVTALTSSASGATYYLDAVNGSDTTDDGSSGSPWKTLSKALAQASGGDTVYLRNGNYGNFTDNTARSDWLTFAADTGHSPVIQTIQIGYGVTAGYNAYLKFDGIDIKVLDTSARTPIVLVSSANYIQLLNCYIYNFNRFENYDVDLTGNNLKVHHCEIFYDRPAGLANYTTAPRGTRGIEMGGSDFIISNNYIHGMAKSGIYIDPGSSGTITDNHVYYMDGDWPGDGDMLHGAGLAFHGGNLTIRRNIFHSCGGQSGMFRLYSYRADNLIIENNLFYDAVGTMFDNVGDGRIGDNCRFVNNTCINQWKNPTSPSEGVERYNLCWALYPDDDNYNGDFKVYNNIIIGKFHNATAGTAWASGTAYTTSDTRIRNDSVIYSCTQAHTSSADNEPGKGANWTNYWQQYSGRTIDAGNNIVYSYWFPYPHTIDDYHYDRLNNSTILCSNDSGHGYGWKGAGWDPEANFFTAGNLYLGQTNHGNQIDFSLKAGSPAINYGDTTEAIAAGKSLGTIGSDGFIQDNGTTRSVTYHSAGCYEYASYDPNNSAPVLQPIGNKSVDENSTLIFTVNATDTDGDTITYSAQNLPSGAAFSSQSFTWTPNYNQSGAYQVTFTASDGQDTDSETITITVNNVNREPVLQDIGDKSTDENSTLTFSISATDADSDSITYSVQDLPAGSVFAARTFTWTPSYSQSGTHQVTFTASDGTDQDTETITITVNNVNRAPVLAAVGNKSVYATNSLSFSISATDADSDTLTYSAQNLPSGAVFSGQSLSWTPTSGQAGTFNVTFAASDGQAQDTETISIVVYSQDTTAPTVTSRSPDTDSIQADLNTLVKLHIVDEGEGIDAGSVIIKVSDNTIYSGDTAGYNSSYGKCFRTGTNADYTFIYQPDESFDYDQAVSVKVTAADLAGNTMSQNSYSFATEMRSFSQNKKVNSQSNNLGKDTPATVRDSDGNILAVWDAGQAGSRDIYFGKLAAGEDAFSTSIQLTNNAYDQCNPAIALNSNNKLYIVWQDNRSGNWDIYSTTSTDGASFSAETVVTDANDNQINPVIAINSSGTAYAAWQDDQNANEDIYVGSSGNDFLTTTTTQVTTNSADQQEPAIAIDAADTVYIAWTDYRNASGDIYAAASNSGPWSNTAVVTNAYSQSAPAIAAESTGSILHFVWVDDTAGNNDIYYASSSGLPASPLTGATIIDDSTSAEQSEPSIAVTGTTGDNPKLFACWKDGRNLETSADSDIYMAQIGSGRETNVLVGDDSTNTNQTHPVIAINGNNHPYLIWTDDRNSKTDIYFAGSTYVEPTAMASATVTPSGATVGTDPAAITGVDDVSVAIPSGAQVCDLNIAISRVKNPQSLSVERLSLPYEFGPSGTDFAEPVTITIPYSVSGPSDEKHAYWYNPRTGLFSQQGITNAQTIKISSGLHAVQFQTTHFTQFFVGSSATVATAAGGGGGGGCSMSDASQANLTEYVLPYIALALTMIVIKLKDYRKSRKLKSIRI